MWKVEQKNFGHSVQGHRDDKWQSQDWNSGNLAPDPSHLTTVFCCFLDPTDNYFLGSLSVPNCASTLKCF